MVGVEPVVYLGFWRGARVKAPRGWCGKGVFPSCWVVGPQKIFQFFE